MRHKLINFRRKETERDYLKEYQEQLSDSIGELYEENRRLHNQLVYKSLVNKSEEVDSTVVNDICTALRGIMKTDDVSFMLDMDEEEGRKILNIKVQIPDESLDLFKDWRKLYE